MVKNGTLASPAMARASSVLPVPGGPTSSTPRGILPPSRWNFCGSRRNSTISSRSSLASSTPATSWKVTRPCASVRSLAFDLPKPMARPEPDCIWRMKNIQTPRIRIIGSQASSMREDRGRAVGLRARVDGDVLFLEPGHQRRIAGRIGLEAGGIVAVGAGDAVAGDRHRLDAAGVELGEELRIGDFARGAALLRRLEQVEQRDQKDGDDRPEREIAVIRIHRLSRQRRRADARQRWYSVALT